MTAAAIRAALACLDPQCPCRRPHARATHCPAHDDARPSLGVDERGGTVLIHCHAGCAQAEVIAALRARGLWPHSGAPTPAHRGRPRGLLEEARAHVLAEARRQPWAWPWVRDLYCASDAIRCRFRAADRARRRAAELGPGRAVWEALALAARVEGEALALEAEVDEILAEGRLA